MENYKPYNQKFIDYYQEKITKIYAISYPGKIIDDLKNNLTDRFNNEEEKQGNSFSRISLAIENATFWDNYICKAILESKPLDKKNPIDRDIDKLIIAYFETISENLEEQPLLFFQLPISKLPIELLKKYLSNIEEIKMRCSEEIEKVYESINELFENNSLNSISEERAQYLLKALYYLSEYDLPDDISKKKVNAAQELMTYLLLNSSKHYGIFENKFITKYLAINYSRKNKIRDININFISFQDIGIGKSNEIQATDNHKILGQNNGESRTININRYLLEACRNKNQLLLLLCSPVFHELRHQQQADEKNANKETDISYMYAANQILNKLDNTDYKRNYYHNEIESDAELSAIVEIHEILEHFELRKDLNDSYTQIYWIAIDTLNKAILYTAANWKEDLQGKKYISSSYINERLDSFFSKNPDTLKDKYSQFQKFYHKDGHPKDITELLMQDYNHCNDFLLGQFISRAKNQTIDNHVIQESTIEEKTLILINYSKLIKACCNKINRLSQIYYIDKDQKTPIDKNDIDNNLELLIPMNMRMYFQTAVSVIKAMQKHLNRYPELADCDIEKYINETNDAISNLSMESMIHYYGTIIPKIEIPIKGEIKK